MKTFNRADWIENDCEYVWHKGCDACPYVVYDAKGFPKCDKEMIAECDQNGLVENEEEFYLDPVVVLEHWHGVLNNITKLMYKNAYLTDAQLRRILESEMCMKIENANWDSWKDED